MHTNFPWSVWTSNSHIRISSEHDGDICHATIASDGLPVLAISLENANRIVACVNACEGISTDQLERIVSSGQRLAVGFGQALAAHVHKKE